MIHADAHDAPTRPEATPNANQAASFQYRPDAGRPSQMFLWIRTLCAGMPASVPQASARRSTASPPVAHRNRNLNA